MKKPEPLREDAAQRTGSATPADRESVLHEKARHAIATGKLPTRRPDRTWGGPGAGARCTICGASVSGDEVELEIEFARDGDGSGFDKHHIHIRCFAAWEAELRKIEPNGRPRVLPDTGDKRHNGPRGDNPYRRGSA